MKLVESFYSFQGEGKFIGRCAVFFRFGGCNLECNGFGCELKSPKTGEILSGCDTIRAVKLSHFEYESVKFADLKARLLELLSALKTKPIVVITGGEPLLHHAKSDFYKFVQLLCDMNLDVHFETNGTLGIDFDKFSAYKRCVFCISPKLSNSGEPREKRLNFKALNEIKHGAKESFYKFVLTPQMIYSGKAKAEIDEISNISPNDIFVMPAAKNRLELDKNSQSVVSFALENGFCYTDRLHIRIYDDKEGV